LKGKPNDFLLCNATDLLGGYALGSFSNSQFLVIRTVKFYERQYLTEFIRIKLVSNLCAWYHFIASFQDMPFYKSNPRWQLWLW